MFRKNTELTLKMEDLKTRSLPILHRNKSWKKLFGNLKDRDIENGKNRIMELEQKQSELRRNLRLSRGEKDKYLKLILKTSDSINRKNERNNVKYLDQYRDKLLEVNAEIDKLEEELETIPDEIKQANIDILNATINIGYRNLAIKEERLEALVEEIETLTEKLKNLKEERAVEETWVHETYTFMHRVLGNDLIEKIDRKISRS